MISVGNFQFIEDKSFPEVRVVEALSRVRKEITIHALLDGFQDEESLYQGVESLEKELEKLDQCEATLSLKTGRFYNGRRRDYVRLIHEKLGLATVKIIVLTEDRFERSEGINSFGFLSSDNGWEWEIISSGNWKSWPTLKLEAIDPLVNPVIRDDERVLVFNGEIKEGEYLLLNSENHTALLNGTENVLNDITGVFPILNPGGSDLWCSFEGGGSPLGKMTVSFCDVWV